MSPNRKLLLFVVLAAVAAFLVACQSSGGFKPGPVATATTGFAVAALAFVDNLFTSGLIDADRQAQLHGIIAAAGDGIAALLHAFETVSTVAADAKRLAVEAKADTWSPGTVTAVAGGGITAATGLAAGLVRAMRGPAAPPQERAARTLTTLRQKAGAAPAAV